MRHSVSMVFAKSLNKPLFLYTDHTDNTVSSVKRRKKIRPLREIRVQRVLKPDFAKAMTLYVHAVDFFA